jgi:uncharacterized protein YdhG (YjbR/CyaY superfamily)
MRAVPKDVDQYIERAPKESQGKLRQLRAVIKEVAPNAVERISYGMPYYEYKGRLLYFGAAKAHIGIYGIPASIIEEFKKELVAYMAEKTTIRLPLDRDLPVELFRKLVRARTNQNEATFL